MTADEQQMHADLRWAMANHQELERKYAGQSIVVFRRRVVAHGIDETELLREAASPTRPRNQLVVVEFPDFLESPR